jgi:DNA polymerase I-like protein with 3'-5' exonuclease and polymerase domains
VSAVLSSEQLPEHLDARLILAVHDELVVESPEDQIKEVAYSGLQND